MNGREMRETARNISSKDFLTERADAFAHNPAAQALIAELTASVANVQTAYQKQLAEGDHVRQDYDEVRDAFDDLFDAVREVSGFAASISKREPGFNKLFPAPSGTGRRKLIAEARVAAGNAEPNEQKLIGRGMDEDFIANLRQKADTLEAVLNRAESSTGKRVGATAALGKDVENASDVVEMLDPIVKKVYKNDPANLAAWKFASHVERHTPVPKLPKPPQS